MRLGVNVDHVATLRQQRRGEAPDPVGAARVCERSGATSIVCHLREDRRHIQDRDVERLRRSIRTRLNLEMSMAPDVVRAALRLRPDEVTLVPERRQELTTEGGLDARRLARRLGPLVERFHAAGIEVSLFIDPAAAQLAAAKALGAWVVELHTGRYAQARTARTRQRELRALQQASAGAQGLGLRVAAGHGLDYENVGSVAAIPEIEELNIGYAIITRAVWVGLEQAVREMVSCLSPRRAHAGVAG